jgi:ribosome-associated protein
MELKGLPLVKAIIFSLSEKKAEDIVVMDMRRVSAIADYFIICSGNSQVHLKALGDAVELDLKGNKKNPTRPYSIEGHGSDTWVLYDYIDVVVHVFNKHAREFYGLDRFWNDAKRINIKTLLKPAKKKAAKRGPKKTVKKSTRKS